jgi:hypothetical protein
MKTNIILAINTPAPLPGQRPGKETRPAYNVPGRILIVLTLVLLRGGLPLYGADSPGAHIEVNLIIDGSAALANVLDEVTDWISGDLLDQRLGEGDRITIWRAGEKAEIAYSETLQNNDAKERITKILRSLPAQGDAADFTGALRDAVSRSSAGSITYTLLVSASAAALSPALQGAGANLMRFSRIEEFRGWRAIVVALNIESRVRQAVASYFSGI